MARTQSRSEWSTTPPCGCRDRGLRRIRASRSAAGFTLAELMVVVVIMGILASVAFASLRKQVSAAWHAEGMSMVQSIRAAEERWRAEHMMYLNVSTNAQWYPTDPTVTTGKLNPFFYPPGSGQHNDQAAWFALRPSVSGGVRFGYLVNAGYASNAMTPASAPGPAVTWPTPPDNWFVIQAIGDTDGNGRCVYYRASSLSGDIFVQDED